MEYNKLISVTGMSGLFEMLSSKNDGAIVKSLEDILEITQITKSVIFKKDET